jgi:hypothetical protein
MTKCRMIYNIHSLLTFDMTEEEKNIFEKKMKEQYERKFKRKATAVKN